VEKCFALFQAALGKAAQRFAFSIAAAASTALCRAFLPTDSAEDPNFLFELEQPPRLREIEDLRIFSWSRIHSSSADEEESRPPHHLRNLKLPIRSVSISG
jgi:hypothetical protein